MDRDRIVEIITDTLDAYYDLLADPADVDTDDLAENIANTLARAGALHIRTA